MNIVYQSQVSNIGWTEAVQTNEVSGESGNNIEAIALSIPTALGHVKYRSFVDSEGWQDWVEDADVSGTVNQGKAIQAVQIELTGDAVKKYDVYYHVNVKGFGWMDWAKNGEVAGTIGLNQSVQELQITYTQKDGAAPGSTQIASIDQSSLPYQNSIRYSAHVRNIGWMDEVSDGQTAGTTGKGLPIEALKINLGNYEALGDISGVTYELQCQDIGWTAPVSNGAEGGTTGQAKHAEAIKINLTGRMALAYDVYYRTHVSNYGWLDWAKNGEVSGTVGLNAPMEAIEIKLVVKDGQAPGETAEAAINKDELAAKAAVNYNVHVSNIGWQNGFSNGAQAGITDPGYKIEAMSVELPNLSAGSGVTYQTHVSNVGWVDPVGNGQVSGTTGQGNPIEAFCISLTGPDALYYDIYYQAYSEDIGWLGWAKNGEYAGTTKGSKGVQAIHILELPKGSPAPGSTEGAYRELEPVNNGWIWPLDIPANISSGFGYREGGNHLGLDILAPSGQPIKAAKSGTVITSSYYGAYGNCVIISNDNSGEQVYYAHMSAYITSVGQHVNQGDVIGYVGCTGNATCNHLHFGIVSGGNWIDPLCVY